MVAITTTPIHTVPFTFHQGRTSAARFFYAFLAQEPQSASNHHRSFLSQSQKACDVILGRSWASEGQKNQLVLREAERKGKHSERKATKIIK